LQTPLGPDHVIREYKPSEDIEVKSKDKIIIKKEK
jgi:hypothetical protein